MAGLFTSIIDRKGGLVNCKCSEPGTMQKISERIRPVESRRTEGDPPESIPVSGGSPLTQTEKAVGRYF